MSEFIVFAGAKRLAKGSLAQAAVAAKQALDAGETAPILFFDAVTSRPVDVDLRGSAEAVCDRLRASAPADPPRGRGRPKLGVAAREVTLLPRHWDWLAQQRGGASAALRRLVDEARRENASADAKRQGKDALYRFATAMAGDTSGYEEAIRALYADEASRFQDLTAAWPDDVRAHVLTLADAAFAQPLSALDVLLSPADRSAAALILKAAFPGGVVTEAQRMTDGASGARVFKVRLGGGDYVLRLEGRPNGVSNSEHQYACMRGAAAAGLAPPLIHADAAAGAAVMAFIEAIPATPPLDRKGQIQALSAAVRRLHAIPQFPKLMPYFDALSGLLTGLNARGLFPPGALDHLLTGYAEVLAVYPQDDDLVSSHNDLNPSNVIFQGQRPYIIDWECAFAADRFVDLAAIANFFAADADEDDLVLATYFQGSVTDRRRARFCVMQQINRLFYGTTLLNAAVGERRDVHLDPAVLLGPRFDEVRGEMATLATAEGRLRFGGAFLAEAAHQMRGSTFKRALQALGAG